MYSPQRTCASFWVCRLRCDLQSGSGKNISVGRVSVSLCLCLACTLPCPHPLCSSLFLFFFLLSLSPFTPLFFSLRFVSMFGARSKSRRRTGLGRLPEFAREIVALPTASGIIGREPILGRRASHRTASSAGLPAAARRRLRMQRASVHQLRVRREVLERSRWPRSLPPGADTILEGSFADVDVADAAGESSKRLDP